MNKRKFFYLISILAILSVVIGYNYMYKNHRNISAEKAEFVIEASDFIKEYNTDIETSITKYLDKTIQLKGEVTEVDVESFTLNNVIICYADSITLKKVKPNSVINVKGRSIGYDELLEYVKLDQVTIINN